MTRRAIILLGVGAALLLAALVPWTVRSDRIVAAVARQVKQGYGVSVTSNGQLTFSLLPLPQFVLSDVRLASADGAIEAETPELRAQLRLLPLTSAQLRLKKVWLVRSRIAATLIEEPAPSFAGTMSRVRTRIGTEPDSRWVPRIDRFILTEADITLRDASGAELARLRKASLILNSPEPDGDLDLTASAEWRGEPVIASLSGLNLAAIRAGRPQEIEAEATGGIGTLLLDGRLIWTARPHFSGSFRAQTPSIARLSRWSGLGADLTDLDRPGSLSGDGVADLDKLQWPNAAIEIGRDRFEGAVAVELAERPKVRATVAGGDLDMRWLGKLVDPSSKADRLSADYDVRLSASSVAFGSLRLREAALSAQSNGRSIEVSLARGGVAGGTLRGRVSAALDGEDRDIRALGWADGVDLERLLNDMTGVRGLSGTATGQFSVEWAGDRGESLARQMRGRGSLQARNGEILGTALGDAAKRSAQAAAHPDWRSGRVRYNQADLAMDFEGGKAKLSQGTIDTAGARSSLAGHLDLLTTNASLRVTTRLSAPATRPPLVIDLNGPIQRLTLSAAGEAGTPP